MSDERIDHQTGEVRPRPPLSTTGGATGRANKRIEVGKAKRLYCNDCLTEYAILHEPEYTDAAMKAQFGGKTKPAKFCPFCGECGEEIEVRQ